MNTTFRIITLFIVGVLLGTAILYFASRKNVQQEATQTSTMGGVMVENTKTKGSMAATFAGGCFWCIEAPYQEHAGVLDAISGYSGGTEETAEYSKVARGETGHRETVQVTYDPSKVSYEELVEIFWRQIDPTDAGGQFADRGFQYTTAIFFHNDDQKRIAEASKKALEESGKFREPIATEILPYSTFFPAEEYHQDYYKKSSEHYAKYKKGSGRSGFIQENWARTAALEYADAEKSSPYKISAEKREELRSALDDLSYKVIAKEGTERPFANDYWDNKEAGIYVDKISGEPLYASVHKFVSGTGWPSFWRAIDDAFLVEKKDKKLFTTRTELRSTYGDSHLGHLFADGPKDKTGLRHCINSAALRFIPKGQMFAEGYKQYLYLFKK
jgi:peptide methionine sulfoxide reductase msrA/msrB